MSPIAPGRPRPNYRLKVEPRGSIVVPRTAGIGALIEAFRRRAVPRMAQRGVQTQAASAPGLSGALVDESNGCSYYSPCTVTRSPKAGMRRMGRYNLLSARAAD